MTLHRPFAAVGVAALWLLSGCATTPPPGEVPTVADALTPGIFLDSEGRAVLPAGVEARPVYSKGLDVTKVGEGFRSRLYNDVAHYCSIAYGHLVKRAPCDGSEATEFRLGISEPRGTEILTKDMFGAQVAVMTLVRQDLSDGQYAALCDFVYNVGPSNFRSSTLLRVVNAGQFDQAPFQFRRWTRAGGREIKGLKNRRESEIRLFFDGLPTPRDVPPAGVDLSPVDIRNGE